MKTFLKPINPYRYNIRYLCHGRVLEVGCGVGRNLGYLGRSDTIGVDHNSHSVDFAVRAGHRAVTTEEFRTQFNNYRNAFETLLISHVLEHLTFDESVSLLLEYLPTVTDDGRVIVICPQERGYSSDETHVTYLDRNSLERIGDHAGIRMTRYRSFPLPRRFGSVWVYNEHVAIYEKSSSTESAR